MWWRHKKQKESPVDKRILRRRPFSVVPRRLRRQQRELEQSQLEHRQFFWRRWSIVVLVVLVFVGVVTYVAVVSPLMRIEQVTIVGGDESTQQQLQMLVDEKMNERRWRLLVIKSFFLFPEKQIRAVVQQQYPHIQSIAFEKRFPQSVKITITTRDEAVIVCSGGPCFVLDEAGRVIANEDALNDSWRRIRLIDTSAAPVDVSEIVLNPGFIVFLEQLEATLKGKIGITVQGDYTTPSRFSGTVTVMTNEGWQLRLDSHISLENTVNVLQAFFIKQIKDPQDRARLEYVDTRDDGKIYYRLAGDDQALISTPPPVSSVTPDMNKTTPDKTKKK